MSTVLTRTHILIDRVIQPNQKTIPVCSCGWHGTASFAASENDAEFATHRSRLD